MSHTPGPWHFTLHGRVVTTTPTTVAQGIPSRADARLIAAAPDLLEWLQIVVADAEEGESFNDLAHIGQRISDNLPSIRAAIAKATEG